MHLQLSKSNPGENTLWRGTGATKIHLWGQTSGRFSSLSVNVAKQAFFRPAVCLRPSYNSRAPQKLFLPLYCLFSNKSQFGSELPGILPLLEGNGNFTPLLRFVRGKGLSAVPASPSRSSCKFIAIRENPLFTNKKEASNPTPGTGNSSVRSMALL